MKSFLFLFRNALIAVLLAPRLAICTPTAIIKEIESIVLDAAIFNQDVLDPEVQSVKRCSKAQQRIAQLGEVGDQAIASIIVLAIKEWETFPNRVPTSKARNHVDRLMKAVRNDPKLATILLPTYNHWIDAIGTEKLTHPSLAITEEAALYIKQWGDESSHQKLREYTVSLSKSSNINLRGIAPNLKMILDNKRLFELPPAPKTAFHQWCKEITAVINADRTPSAFNPKLAAKPNALESKPAPTPSNEPASSTPWSIIAVLIVAAIGLLWLLLKRRS